MTLTFNPAGYGRALNEKELYCLIEDYIYMKYDKVKKQYRFDIGCILDYFALDLFTKKPILIEVKNWFLAIKDMEQLIKYYVHATEMYGENKFTLIVYAGGCDSRRLKILEKLGIEVYLTKDLVT